MSLFRKRWLKLFVRQGPVGREVSLILRLYSTFNREKGVLTNMARHYIYSLGQAGCILILVQDSNINSTYKVQKMPLFEATPVTIAYSNCNGYYMY